MAMIRDEEKKFLEKGSFVKKGTTIIKAEPFVAVLSSKFRSERCDNCFKSCKIFRCAGCQYVYYCSKNCQRKSWIMHKIECPNMKRVHPLEVPDAVRMITHIITKLQNGGGEERGYYSSSEYRTFGDLMSHYYDIREDMKRMEHFVTLCTVIREFLPDSILPSKREVLDIFGRMCINSFHVLDSDMKSVGVGIYLGPSIIDHSCRANTSTVFDGTTLIIRATRDITSFDWSKVTISYIDVMRSVEERRKDLQSSYYFRCDCERCENPEPGASAAACPNKNCTNPCFPKNLKCTKCNEIFPTNFQQDFELLEAKSLRYLEKMEKMKSDSRKELEICRMLLKEQEGLLHTMNMLHVRMLEMASPAANDLELWEEAAIYAKKLTEIYEYYHGDSHPLTGGMYLTLATVLAFGDKPKQAYNVVRKASEIVKIAFGENHPKMQEVKLTTYRISVECKRINDNRF